MTIGQSNVHNRRESALFVVATVHTLLWDLGSLSPLRWFVLLHTPILRLHLGWYPLPRARTPRRFHSRTCVCILSPYTYHTATHTRWTPDVACATPLSQACVAQNKVVGLLTKILGNLGKNNSYPPGVSLASQGAPQVPSPAKVPMDPAEHLPEHLAKREPGVLVPGLGSPGVVEFAVGVLEPKFEPLSLGLLGGLLLGVALAD